MTFAELPRPVEHTTMSLPFPLHSRHPAPRTGDASDLVARAGRLAELVRELLPLVRRQEPHLSEAALVETAEQIAANRLADEELARRTW